MTYRLTRQAERDVLSIHETSVRLFGLVQADRYLASLKSTFEFLGQFPLAARERPELSPSVRIHPHQAHLIVYSLDDAGVLIIRVRHGHEDWLGSPGAGN